MKSVQKRSQCPKNQKELFIRLKYSKEAKETPLEAFRNLEILFYNSKITFEFIELSSSSSSRGLEKKRLSIFIKHFLKTTTQINQRLLVSILN